MLRLSVLLAAGLLSTGIASAQGTWGITQLMQSLAQVKAASSRFVERKTLHMLSEPIIASGTLRYVAPDEVEKLTLSPARERLVVKGDSLTFEGGSPAQSRTMSLAANPEVAAIVEGIRATLAGDLATLDRFYRVQLSGNAGDWQLSLEPKQPAVQKFISSIRIAGAGNAIRSVATTETDGDYSTMSVVEQPR
ncbi:MAG TPA: LolA-related protein [Candidatus Sulfotelmatobacter sp.]|nr:LolA-related protein [Candidatus Sulfotelmatobacter sp.]